MKNKDLIAHLQQFDNNFEVWIVEKETGDEWIPTTPIMKEHLVFEPRENATNLKKLIFIPFSNRLDGN